MNRIALALGAGLIALAGCSSEGNNSPALDFLRAKIAGAKSGGQVAPPALSRAQLAGIDKPVVVITVEKSGGSGAMVMIRENDGAQTYFTSDRTSLTLRRGMVIATRGLGEDLMFTDAFATSVALRTGGGGDLPRTHRYLDGENHTLAMSFTCSLVKTGSEGVEILGRKHQTRHFRESCANETVNFVNEYWVSASNGQIWQSRQWVGPETGVLLVQVVQR